MPQKLKEVDVVVIGVGFAGSILAKELAASGLKVVGLERGPGRHSVPDFQAPAIHDELKYSIRKGMMQDVTREAMTFRNHHREVALPMRQWEAERGRPMGCGWVCSSRERPGLAIPRGGIHIQDPHRAALREEDPGPD